MTWNWDTLYISPTLQVNDKNNFVLQKVYLQIFDWISLTWIVIAMFHHNVHPQVFFTMGAMRTKHATHLFFPSAFVQMSSQPFRVFVAFLTVGTLMTHFPHWNSANLIYSALTNLKKAHKKHTHTPTVLPEVYLPTWKPGRKTVSLTSLNFILNKKSLVIYVRRYKVKKKRTQT